MAKKLNTKGNGFKKLVNEIQIFYHEIKAEEGWKSGDPAFKAFGSLANVKGFMAAHLNKLITSYDKDLYDEEAKVAYELFEGKLGKKAMDYFQKEMRKNFAKLLKEAVAVNFKY